MFELFSTIERLRFYLFTVLACVGNVDLNSLHQNDVKFRIGTPKQRDEVVVDSEEDGGRYWMTYLRIGESSAKS